MRKENPDLPAVVKAGDDNPLGDRAMYLGWPLYRIHGTNLPAGVGRRTSSGCMRMYPEDIHSLFDHTAVGSPVTVINDPVIAQMVSGRLWMSVFPTLHGWDQVEDDQPVQTSDINSDIVDLVSHAAAKGTVIDWDAVHRAMVEARGYPVAVSR